MVSRSDFSFDLVVAGDCPHDEILDSSPPTDRPGGAVYSAMIARALGGRVAIVGDMGDDAHAKACLDMLDGWGIDRRGVELLPGPTPTFKILNSDEIVPQVVSSVFSRFRPIRPETVPEDYSSARALLMYPYDRAVLMSLANRVRASGGLVYFDLQHDIRSLGEWAELLALTNAVFASSGEILHITGQVDIRAAASAIQLLGPELVIVKLGLGGSSAYPTGKEEIEIPCYQSRFKCTIGAGDAYNAAFAIAELNSHNLAASARTASVVASLFVEQLSLMDIFDVLSGADLDLERDRRTPVFLPPDRAAAIRVYVAGHFLAAPLAIWGRTITAALESRGFTVFLPPRDVGILTRSNDAVEQKRVFEEDLAAIDSCNVVVALLDGAGRGGTSFEIGYAHSRGIPVLALLTDGTHPHSNMVVQACNVIASTPGELLNQLYDKISAGEIPVD